MNIVRVGPGIELNESLTGQMETRRGLVVAVPMDGLVGCDLSTSEVAQWKQVAFHDEMFHREGMPDVQADLHATQRDIFLGKLQVIGAQHAPEEKIAA